MLNPSTADAETDDATIRKCTGFVERWSFTTGEQDLLRGVSRYGGFYVLNLFGYRATDPADLKAANEPFGSDNHAWQEWYLKFEPNDSLFVAAWGNHGSFCYADKPFKRLVMKHDRQLHCLGRTKTGHPRHPLMLSYDARLEAFY